MMEEAIRKAEVLIEALGWIRRFRGRHFVIKLGGSVMDDTPESRAAIRAVLKDVIFLASVGARPILVHGGGKSISRALGEAGIDSRFVHGRRFTDAASMQIVAHVLLRTICRDLVETIDEQGGQAWGPVHPQQAPLLGEKLTLPSEQPGGERIDLGMVGQVTAIEEKKLRSFCADGVIPVIPCIARGPDGNLLNVNADTAAAALARLLQAEKLMFLSDVPGIFEDKNDPETRISHVSKDRCKALIAEGTIDAGMVPKVEAAVEALSAGVQKVHIVDAGMPHSVLLEIFSDKGVGTEIVAQ